MVVNLRTTHPILARYEHEGSLGCDANRQSLSAEQAAGQKAWAQNLADELQSQDNGAADSDSRQGFLSLKSSQLSLVPAAAPAPVSEATATISNEEGYRTVAFSNSDSNEVEYLTFTPHKVSILKINDTGEGKYTAELTEVNGCGESFRETLSEGWNRAATCPCCA